VESLACVWGKAFSLPPGFCPASSDNREERRLKEVAEKSQSHSWPPMNTDERRLKTIALSAFISVDRRLNLPFPDFFSSL
jgi:hypothetical protein